MRWLYLHAVCGKPAFAYLREPQKGEIMRSKYAQHLDGTPVKQCEAIICDSCHRPLFAKFFSLTRVVKEEDDGTLASS